MKTGADVSHLKLIDTGLNNYYLAHKRLPPPFSNDKNGKPLLSWRVLILPYMAEEQLYAQFRLDEPWDSEHNRKLIPRIPECYRDPWRGKGISYLAVTGPLTVWPGKQGGISYPGTASVVVVEGSTIEWTQPEDIRLNDLLYPKVGMPAMRWSCDGVSYCLMSAGGIKQIEKCSPKELTSLFRKPEKRE